MKPALQLKRSGRADPHRPPLGSATVLTCGVALQLRFTSDVGLSRGGLVGASPEGPGDDVSGPDAPLSQPHSDTPDLLRRPADQAGAWRARLGLFGGGTLSVVAVSNASSMAQRRPSTATSVLIGVPAGHQVEK